MRLHAHFHVRFNRSKVQWVFCFVLLFCSLFVYLLCFVFVPHITCFKAYGWRWVPGLPEIVDEALIDGWSFIVAVIRQPMLRPPPANSICAMPPEILRLVSEFVCVSELVAIHGYEDPTVLSDDEQEMKEDFFHGEYYEQYHTADFNHYWF
jgi:hypothetical protein